LDDIGIDPTAEFVQMVGVVTDNGNIDLYVNGTLAAQDTGGLISDWDGSNDAGLGFNNEGINFNSPSAFEGEIAIFNFYESALTGTQVLDNYQAVAGFSVTEVNGAAISLDTPMSLTNGTLIMAADGSYQYTPAGGFNGVETFTYTIENNNGDIDTASVAINVTNPINGSTSAETLNGTTDNDFLSGDAGDDTLVADAGKDILFGGTGSDTMTGDAGGDTFIWKSGDADGSTDSITDFTLGMAGVGESDSIDISDLLQNEENNPLSDYLTVTDDGTDVSISVDVDGSGGDVDMIIMLEGIGTGLIDLNSLTENNQIVFDV
jgi:Ca2+-binding RTX toxin-like protein